MEKIIFGGDNKLVYISKTDGMFYDFKKGYRIYRNDYIVLQDEYTKFLDANSKIILDYFNSANNKYVVLTDLYPSKKSKYLKNKLSALINKEKALKYKYVIDNFFYIHGSRRRAIAIDWNSLIIFIMLFANGKEGGVVSKEDYKGYIKLRKRLLDFNVLDTQIFFVDNYLTPLFVNGFKYVNKLF